MSLTFRETLASLALGQALLVVPQLGESYDGKTAGTIAAMLLMLSADIETIADRRNATRAALAGFLAEAHVEDRALRHDIDYLMHEHPPATVDERYWALLAVFTLVHAWADAHSPDLALRCRRFLADWAESERLAPPALPTG